MAAAITHTDASGIEQLATQANWLVRSPYVLEKEYTFMNAAKASAFSARVGELLQRHWVQGEVRRSGDRAIVSLQTRNPSGITHDDLELAMTVEALREMSAATREKIEAAVD